ncbi:MAG: succinate dehydrogenase, hydrophobic membrane anchor protein, partial [Betaproteobacteria bacterium]
PGPLDYYRWAAIFSSQWMKVLTVVVIVSLAWHAWVGVRALWMDYVKHTGVRLALQTLTVLWLLFCAVWSVQILWRV